MKRTLILCSLLAVYVGIVIVAAHPNISNQSQPAAPQAKKEPVRKFMLITAYCGDPRCKICVNVSRWRDGKTALGDDASVLDGVAADFNLLPRRTKLWIPGVGRREVDDTGSAMRRSAKTKGIYHVDLRLAKHEEALGFAGGKGKIVAWVEVFDPIPDPPYPSFRKKAEVVNERPN